ncbi:MAG: Smr/MutS family protein [Anaerolineales bacterium]|nr:Smr/MutS family protein [Anaerolineales bacterium]
MDKHLVTLEFPKILDKLAYYAMFSASKGLALALRPSPYLAEAQGWQAETSEAVHLLSAKVGIGIGGARDVRPLTGRAQRGAILIPPELLEIRQTLVAARDLQRTITRLAEVYPRLADIAQRIEPCPGLVNDISQAVDERGEVKSSASPELARIRRELETAYSRLMERLNRLVASTQYSRYLQEPLVTQRAGRYVLPLKAEFKGRIQGIIHDQSASGATLFIEPLVTVELNNKWRQLQLDEEEEIRKILLALSEQVSGQSRLIDHTVAALAELDLAFAKAKYAEAIDAVEPVLINPDKTYEGRGAGEQRGRGEISPAPLPSRASASTFKLGAARHPLLDSATVVPITITLPAETRMLIITGPNTGGKTVSLKTVGLLAAMAQAGLRIPAAEGSTLPFFNRIFADIGDEQSIEQSLSTFSSHMTNIVQILEQCDHRSLVILDELGAGTDPIEGSALARSILSYLLERQVTTFVATHYSELKAFAHTTPGVANASMEFNVATLSPTFRLLIGLPGASNAFTIAQRLGLPVDIIDRARGLVSEDAQQIEAMLAEIKAQTETAHQVRRQAEEEHEEAEKQAQQIQKRLAEIDTERRDILNAAREDARREIKAAREEIRALKEQVEAEIKARAEAEAKAKVESPPDVKIEEQLTQLETKIQAKIERDKKSKAKPAPQPPAPGTLSLGDKVFIPQFNTVGEVVGLQNKQVEVQLGAFRSTVPLANVVLQEKAAPREAEVTYSSVKVPTVESPGMELDLRGQVTEEALLRLDQYLDQAFLARLPWVRIIHGRGSGALRQAVRQELSGHPMVSSYRPGDESEGGEGVTVAKLAHS